ncbi:MAG: hypothetical protein IT230_07180 [Flavobacteriales bacterium]|nr:hypothetical protein [Flavobacteriales bacterium]
MKTRIAPTPSGYLHAGNGAAFVLAWQLAQEAGGKVLLRIDDLDAERARTEYVQDIFDTLAWLGIGWEEGPHSPQELTERWSQYHRLAHYHRLLAELRAAGHLYACDCSRRLIAKRGATAEYDGHCRRRGLDLDGPEMAWRMRLPEAGTVALREWPTGTVRQHALDLPDPVVRQRNGRPAYQVASLSDDLRFGVDTIVRGMDLLPSTLIQLYMAEVLEHAAFSKVVFLHHGLIAGADGGKLSKSAGAGSLKHWRETGRGPEDVLALAERLRASARA